MMCGAFRVAMSLPSLLTPSVFLPASLPLPSNTVTLLLRSRCATPEESCFATARDRFTTFPRSKRDSTGSNPKSVRWCSRWLISLVRSSALVGIQPQFRQMPPRCSRSTTAVFMPSCAARIAATYPPGPPPRTTRSNACSAMGLSFRQGDERVAAELSCVPVLHRFCADTPVEVDGGLIPVENAPFEARAVFCNGALRDVPHQRQPDAGAAIGRFDKQVFEEDVRAGLERAECVEEQCKADGRAVGFSQDGMGSGQGAE